MFVLKDVFHQKIFFPNLTFFLFFQIIIFSDRTVTSLNIYVSNLQEVQGDGSQLNPFQTILESLSVPGVNDILNLLILTKQEPYLLNSSITLNFDLSISSIEGLAVLDFYQNGSLHVDGNYSLSFENMIIQQTSPSFFRAELIRVSNGAELILKVIFILNLLNFFFHFFSSTELCFNKNTKDNGFFNNVWLKIIIILQNKFHFFDHI